ncbi:MAG: DGQHR domain-containing protein [Alloalcanivorax venustensis]|uniref:DGQHR domain-containing protein n=2 Tax=Pseudomonadota TaxID=1224 RepID=UPI0032989AA1
MAYFEGKLLNDPSQISREATRRRKDFKEVSVSDAQKNDYESAGYYLHRTLKTKYKMRKRISPDERLENRVWMLMFLLGYPEINKDRNFKISIERKNSPVSSKQIDILAKDDETVVVAECKANTKVGRRSLQKDIEEFANLKGPISNSIKKHYGNGFKPKIIWMFFTENIIWSEPDLKRASSQNIHIVTEKELRYFTQIAEHLRSAARYQFLAEFLKDQKIPQLSDRRIPAIRGTLGGKRFYAFISHPEELLKISFVNHRSLNDPQGAPSYQRLVSKSRLKKIGEFIKSGGFFPTNILINFTKKVRFDQKAKDEKTGVVWGDLYLPDRYRSAWIIDGQHRLYGYAPLKDNFQKENVAVIAFEQLEKTEEANLFVTINHEQKSVPKNLLDDLEGELSWGSKRPGERIGAIAARLINILNEDIGEPFYNRVTRQGIPATERTCLTVPGIKDGLRKSTLIGRVAIKNQVYQRGSLCCVDDHGTLQRAREALNLYFNQIKSANTEIWDAGRPGYLCTNTAVHAYLLLFNELINYMAPDKGMDPLELTPQELISEIEEYLDPVLDWLASANLSSMETNFKVKFGSGGPKEYFFKLSRIIKEKYEDFSPDGIKEWEEEQSEDNIQSADRKLKDINIVVQNTIFTVLKDVYGHEGTDYWEKGVTEKSMKVRAYEKSIDDDENLPLEHYLDFIDYKKIAEKKANWPHLKPYLDIPEPGDKGQAKNIKWMERINELRRIPAHATSQRTYKVDDFEYIDYIFEELGKRISDDKWIKR